MLSSFLDLHVVLNACQRFFVGHGGILGDGTKLLCTTMSSRVEANEERVLTETRSLRNRPIEGEHPYVYLDGIVLKR